MNDSQFDDFVNDKLGEFAAPVPAGLWEKVAEGQFDQFVGGKLKDFIAPVPAGLWEKVSEGQFDQFVGSSLKDHTAAVPNGLWEKITDGQFDAYVGNTLAVTEAPVSAGLWDKIADGQFDSFVADKVKDHEAPVPAGLWEKIHPEEDDDRVAFWWFRYPAAAVLLLALLTAGAWGGYMFFTREKNTTEASRPVVSPAVSSPEAAKANEVLPKANDIPGGVAVTDQQPKGSDQAVANLPSVSQPEPPVTNRIQAQAGNGQSQLPPIRYNTALGNPYEITHQNSALSNTTQETAVVSEQTGDAYIEPYQPGFSEALTVSIPRYHSLDLSGKHLTAGKTKFKSVIICPADKGRNPDWFLETYLSPDIAFKSVSNVSSTPLYMLKKDSSEHSRVGYTAGIRLVKPITDNILLKAGLQYSQANEQYVYRTENEVKTTTVVTVRTIIRAPGDTVVVQDTSVLQTAGFKTNTVKNRYRSFDIPVTVGYQFGDDDLKFGINAGVVVNLTSWYQGMVLDTSLANVPLNKSGNNIYKTNIGLGLIGSVSIVKRITDDLHIFAEPYFRYNLSNMSTSQSGFNQRLSVGGLSLGLRFKLNKY